MDSSDDLTIAYLAGFHKAEQVNQWKEAVLNHLAITHMDSSKDEEPMHILNKVINWHVFSLQSEIELIKNENTELKNEIRLLIKELKDFN